MSSRCNNTDSILPRARPSAPPAEARALLPPGRPSRARSAALLAGLLALLAGAAEGAATEPTATEPTATEPTATEPAATEPAPRRSPGALGDLVVRARSETSYYADTDHVTVTTPVLAASVESPLAGWSLTGHYLVDVVTAASVDIVATASPPWQEARHAFAAGGAYKPGDLGGSLSVSGSVEPDYLSLSASAGLTWDVWQKRATLSLGYGYSHDVSGRSGTPFHLFARPLDRHSLNAGASLILTRATVLSVLGDAVIESGDPSKPYRYIPMFEPGAASGVPAGAAISYVNAVRAHERPLEQLPLSRGRFALTARLAHRFSASTVRLDERLYADTWGVRASTTDARVFIDVDRRLSFGPHLRFHAQTGATFWRRAYELEPTEGGRLALPALRTGDRELGPLLTLTGGLSIEYDMSAVAGSHTWQLVLQADGMSTHHLDALYIERKDALFTAATLAVTLD